MKDLFSLGMNPITDITKWVSEHSLLISLWGVLTGTLGKLMQITTNPNMIVSSIADVTLVLSFLIAVFTVFVKGKEFVEAYFPTIVRKLKLRKRTKK